MRSMNNLRGRCRRSCPEPDAGAGTPDLRPLRMDPHRLGGLATHASIRATMPHGRVLFDKAHPVFRGVVTPSSDQRPDERAEQLLASFPCIVNELEEAEVDRQLFLRNSPMRA